MLDVASFVPSQTDKFRKVITLTTDPIQNQCTILELSNSGGLSLTQNGLIIFTLEKAFLKILAGSRAFLATITAEILARSSANFHYQ